MAEKLVQGIFVTILCMSIVFLVLAALYFVIEMQRRILDRIDGTRDKKAGKPVKEAVQTKEPAANEAEDAFDEELIAVIAAAIASALGRPASSIKVRSIRSLESFTPSWSTAGRQDQINTRF